MSPLPCWSQISNCGGQSFYDADSRDQTQVARHEIKHTYLLSNLISAPLDIFYIEAEKH